MSDKPSPVLHAEDAQITTATITIKTIQVGRKQMTQSVFRQLPEIELIDEDACELTTKEIWGWVSYRWGEMPEGTRQFLVQKDSRLFRSPIVIRTSASFNWRDDLPFWYEGTRDTVERILRGIHWKAALEAGCIIEQTNVRIPPFKPFAVCVRCPEEKVFATSDYWGSTRDQIEKALGRIHLGGRALESWTPEQLEQEKNRLSVEVLSDCAKWDAMMEQLENTEQLFIAC